MRTRFPANSYSAAKTSDLAAKSRSAARCVWQKSSSSDLFSLLRLAGKTPVDDCEWIAISCEARARFGKIQGHLARLPTLCYSRRVEKECGPRHGVVVLSASTPWFFVTGLSAQRGERR